MKDALTLAKRSSHCVVVQHVCLEQIQILRGIVQLLQTCFGSPEMEVNKMLTYILKMIFLSAAYVVLVCKLLNSEKIPLS
jgi:hypothetical protein